VIDAPVAPGGGSLRRVIAGVIPVTIVAQLASFGASLALAHVLGATVATDAYFLGLSVPLTIYGILLAGVRLGAIPSLTERKVAEPAEFNRVSSEIVTSTAVAAGLLSALITLVTVVSLPAAISHGGDELVSMTRTTVVELAPLGVLGALVGVIGAVLAAWGSFVPAAAVMALDPVARTILVLALGSRWGADALVVGNLAGSGLAVVVLWVVAERRGVRIRFVRGARTAIVRDVLKLSGPLLIAQSVLQVNPVIDRSMAAGINSGSVTELELGLRLFAFPATLVAAGLIGPLTATWAERKARGGLPVLRESLFKAMRALIVVLPPIVVAGMLVKVQSIELLYEGGEFSAAALGRTADVFGLFLLGLPATALTVVLSTLFVVEHDSVFPMKIALANVVLNVGLNLLLRGPLGAAGIALSTTLTLTALSVAYIVVPQRRWRMFELAALRGTLARAALATAAATGLGLLALELADPATTRLGNLAAVAIVAVIAAAVQAVAFLTGRDRAAIAALLPFAPSSRRAHV
jgi:putative peptidoglycan lipid II flippase